MVKTATVDDIVDLLALIARSMQLTKHPDKALLAATLSPPSDRLKGLIKTMITAESDKDRGKILHTLYTSGLTRFGGNGADSEDK